MACRFERRKGGRPRPKARTLFPRARHRGATATTTTDAFPAASTSTSPMSGRASTSTSPDAIPIAAPAIASSDAPAQWDPICFRRLCPCPGILCLASTQCHHHLQCLATCILHPGGRPSSCSQTSSTPVRRHWTNEAVKKPYMDLSAKQEVEWNKNKKKLGAMRKRSRTTTPSSWRLWQLPHGMDTQSLMSQMKTAAQKTGKQRSTRRRRKRRVRRKWNRRISQKRESDRGAGRGRKKTGSRSLDANSIPGKELAATNAVSTRICCALKKKMLQVCVCVGDWEGPLGEQ